MADETPTTPQDTNTQETPASGVPSLEDILLPQKDAPSRISTQRVNAAEVLEAATAAVQSAPHEETAPSTAPETQTSQPPHHPGDVMTLHTYKSDIEETVRSKHVSLADIAAAQARRREEAPLTPQETVEKRTRTTKYIIIGVVFLVAALGIMIATIFFSAQKSAVTATAPASYIYVDDTQVMPIATLATRDSLMQTLETAREGTHLALGLIERLYPVVTPEATTSSATAQPQAETTQELFSTLALGAPDTLARALLPNFVLGVHVFDGNQPFLIFKTDSYEQVFAGMLTWETSMQSDLSPLFDRTPTAHIAGSGSTAAQAVSAPQLLSTPFIDRVVENHDARVIQNSSGDILLLWTFIDRNTLVITTNEYTLREIISRLSQAPSIAVPAQQ